MLGTNRFIKSITLTNFLSYGPSANETELKSLNVIIGPNASGKSNLIEALGILQAAPRDITEPIREGGGIAEWLWKGSPRKAPAEIEVVLENPVASQLLRYRLSFTVVGQRFEIFDEALENKERSNSWEDDVFFFYRYQKGRPSVSVRDTSQAAAPRTLRHLKREDFDPGQSVLAQMKDPDQYPELTFVGRQFASIRLYREWDMGRFAPPRLPQKPDLPQDFLLDDARNLVLVLNALEHKPGVKRVLINRLKEVYPGAEDFTAKIDGGTVQLFLHERGLQSPVPATRLSDGTLRYLCLLTILCHPAPPPIVCIEEPELGLHPDALKSIAELLVEASNNTQLVVTTHSETLVSRLSDVPGCILVCERGENGTTLSHPEEKGLKKWLQDYSLGELWRMGELGGNP